MFVLPLDIMICIVLLRSLLHAIKSCVSWKAATEKLHQGFLLLLARKSNEYIGPHHVRT
jgi:hypothetical protein